MAVETGTRPKLLEASQLAPRREETGMDLIMKFACEEDGASAVEYGLLLAFIAVTIVAAVTTFGTTVQGLFASVSF
jgi:pilus assembly protein Flp/PilA